MAQAMTTDEAIKALSGRDFTVKQEAITTIAASGEPYAADLFTALDKGELFFRKSDELMVIRQGDTFVNLTDKQAVAGDSSDFKSLAVENHLRQKWEQMLSRYIKTSFATTNLANFAGNIGTFIQQIFTVIVLW